MKRVYLDANILIAAFEDNTDLNSYVWRVLTAVEEKVIAASTSQLTLAEVLPKPLNAGQADLVESYEHLLSSAGMFEVVPVTAGILRLAAQIRADWLSRKLPDAIHVATAREANCNAILTGDRRLGSSLGPLVLKPGPNSLEQILALA